MKFPTLETLEQRNLAQVQASFPELEPQGKGILELMAKMHAQAMHMAYGMIDYHVKQLFPQTATGEFLDNLLTWRPLARLAAKPANGTATISGRASSVVPKGSVISADNGQRYKTTAKIRMSGANQIIRIAALKSGKAANATGEKGKFEAQINGVSPDVLVSATGGTDAETDDEYRSRALAIIQKRSSSYGKKGDYAAWAIAADREIVKAWEVPNIENGGALGIVVAGSDLATVSDGALQNAKTAIEQNKLAGVDTTMIRAKVKTLDFRLKIVPDSAALRVATKNALETQIVQNQKPAAQIALSNLKAALESGVTGLSSLAILSPVADIKSTQREILKLGAVSWS